MRIYNNRIKIILALVAVGAAIFNLGCGKQKPETNAAAPKVEKQAVEVKTQQPEKEKPVVVEPPKPEDTEPKFVLSGKKPTISWVEKGSLKMRAEVKELNGDAVNNVVVLQDFVAEMYEGGKITATMKAPKVVTDGPARIVTATGGVELKSLVRKIKVTAKWMRWFVKEQRVVGVGDVKVTSEMGGDMNMIGNYFEADTGLKAFKVTDEVKGIKIK